MSKPAFFVCIRDHRINIITRTSEPRKSSVVAIHGLGGHPFRTWTNRDGHLWLRDSLPNRVPNVRIMTFGYDSKVLFGRSRSTIHDFAIDLITRLNLARQHIEERQRPVIFVCHSLGGVVFKQLLVSLSVNRSRSDELLQRIFGVVFMGTPHRGSRVASSASVLGSIINAATLGTGVRSELVRNLEISSVELETISRNATKPLGALTIVSFYEQRPFISSLIVEPFSAILGLHNERAIPLDADHKDIARPSPTREQLYLPIWAAIKDLVEESSTTETDPEKNRELLNQLFCVDYTAAQFLPRQPHEGTCRWIFTDSTYLSWLNSAQSSMLLLTGPAGAGKSVLTRYLVESVLSGSQNEATDTGYVGVSFFCSYSKALSTSIEVILRSLLHQLLQLNPRSSAIASNRLQTRDRFGSLRTDLRIDVLWATLADIVSMTSMRRLFLVIDAVEELGVEAAISMIEGLRKTVQFLNDRHPEARLRVFISSRHRPEYESAVSELTILRMDNLLVGNDIQRYVQQQVQDFAARNSTFRAAISDDAGRGIVVAILAKADGRFLQSSLLWEEFCRRTLWNRSIVEDRLRRLSVISPGLSGLYDRIIEKMEEYIREDGFIFFSILAATIRPLSEEEMGTLLAICHSPGPFIHSASLEPFKDVHKLMELQFPDLIQIQANNTATFAHVSFLEYLQCRPDFKDHLLGGHRRIGKACLEYLGLEDVVDDVNRVSTRNFGDHLDELCSKYPLLKYAYLHHIYHISKLPCDDPLWLDFAATAQRSSFRTSKILQQWRHVPTPLGAVLDLVSLPGTGQLIRKFTEHGYNLDEEWPHFYLTGPLNFCCSRAYDDRYNKTALLLLELGADPNLPRWSPASNLEYLIEKKAWALYEVMLRHPGFDPNVPNRLGEGLLHLLVKKGFSERISEAIASLDHLNVNLQDSEGFTPLHLAVNTKRAEIIPILMQTPGIRLDVADTRGRTPLALATYWGSKSIALLLIQNSPAVPVPEDGQLSPFVLAAIQCQKDICLSLLELSEFRDLDRHVDLKGRGILHVAAINNWDDVLTACITRGSGSGLNINNIDHSGKSALHHSARLGNIEACSVLIDHGASLTLQDRNGRTAAHEAADAGFKDALVLIMKTGRVNPNQRDLQGRNLVHWMATIDCVDAMEILDATYNPGVEWTRRDNYSKQPIDIAMICRCGYVGFFLLARTPGRSDMRRWFRAMMRHSLYAEAVDDSKLQAQEEFDRMKFGGMSPAKSGGSRPELSEHEQLRMDQRYGLTTYKKQDNPFRSL